MTVILGHQLLCLTAPS
jgi:hypothetical protein